MQPSHRIEKLEYSIREVAVRANQLQKAGRRVIYLNIGDPVLFDFKTPAHIKDALIRAVSSDYNWYSQSEGLPELREAISESLKRTNVDVSPDNIIATTGTSEGVNMVMGSLLDAGDEVLIPSPTYPIYTSYASYFGGSVVTYRTVEEEGWSVDVEDLKRKSSPKTKAIVLINPNNPTSALWDRSVLKQIVDFAAERNLIIISDEIYDKIVFEKEFTSLASMADDVPVIGLNGFSKAYLMSGWRLGYIYFHDRREKLRRIKDGVLKSARIRLSANTPVQKAAVEALRGPQDHIKKMVDELRRRRDCCVKIASETELMTATVPQGAFYFFPKIKLDGTRWRTDKEFIVDLLEKTGVCVVHGSSFGAEHGSEHFRMTFLPSVEVLEEALGKIHETLSRPL